MTETQLDLAVIKALGLACANCQGGGMEQSGAEYAGIHEYVGCQECLGSGVDVLAALTKVERLTAENTRLREQITADSDSMVEASVECPSCGASIRAHVARGQ